ncbi:restriction endonuclease subunit S [Psychrobacter sp. NG254]|uniref:restriction endonuclease subunit S n=1 Tax=Psychrobacter sp. NG254 TaxID=2782003 RepID=UPI0018883D64|nr:restriction endonuclease subunit S [Psychrobacter sp. NG254]MBF2719409.1 restriction endonuclease subunit S [Psychrobacter sp. NG254]
MVPNGWEVKKLEDVVSKTRKITYGIVVPGPYEPNGNLMIRAKDYSFGWQPIESIYRVSDKMHQSYKRSQVRKGDVLLTIVGSIGNTAIVPEDLEGANITQQTARLSFDEHDANFFYSVMSSETGKKEIYRYAKSGVQPSLNLADIAKFKVPVPPFPEQQKIAKILSTWDKAISITERLIDNSTQQKKALMQQLLTGKKRLLDESGKWFEGEWEVVKLQSVLDLMRSGLSRKLENDNVGIAVIRSNNMGSKYTSNVDLKYWYLDDPQGANVSNYILDDGDLLVNFINSLSQIGKACIYRKNLDVDAIYTTNILRIKPNTDKVDPIYLYLLTQTANYDSYITSITKPAVNQASFTTKEFGNLEFNLPPLKEQQKIATVLTNADKEIELLEQQLADLQQEKKALMQVLLTGKKRVVVDGDNLA